MVLEEAEDLGEEELVDLLNSVVASGREILGVVNDVLAASRMDSIVDPDWVDFEEQLRGGTSEQAQTILEVSSQLMPVLESKELGEFCPDIEKVQTAAKRFLKETKGISSSLGGFQAGETVQDEAVALVGRVDEKAEPRTSKAERKGKILVVDDNEMNRDLLQRHLVKLGHEALLAEGGEEGLQRLTDESFDLVLLDVMMPGLNGHQVLQHLKSDPTLRDVPVIMISAFDELSSVVRCIENGAEDYLPKPFDPVLLNARVGACLEKKWLHDLEEEQRQEMARLNKELVKRNEFIRRTFGRYLSDEIVESILESPEGLKIGGEKREVTIMMTDIRGFTVIGERLPAEAIVSMINIYLEAMTEIILKYDGTIDEFIGDAILVIFGAPFLRPDDPQRAVACAIEMQLAMEEVNQRFQELGYPEVEMGIGINTGEVVVGNIGSSKRSKYGVVGHQVNLTSRIESYTVGGQIYVSENTLDRCGSILRVDGEMEVLPKGVDEEITIYDIGGIGGDFNVFLPERTAEEFVALDPPLLADAWVIEGKDIDSEMFRAELSGLSTTGARLVSDYPVQEKTNLKLQLLHSEDLRIGGAVYAKITAVHSQSAGEFSIVFTSVPYEVDVFIDSLLSEES
jgi:adenylate cyclase